jgi:hypothetical protein
MPVVQSNLPSKPGAIFIGGEQITYWENIVTDPITGEPVNQLRNIRRAIAGTSIQDHAVGSIVYDATAAQAVPGLKPRTAIISSKSSFSSSTKINYWRSNSSSSRFTTVDRVTYKLALSGKITANAGDSITQLYSNAVAVVRGNVSSSNTVAVTFTSGNITTANTNCVISINGVSNSAAPTAISILGAVDVDGNVTVTVPNIAGVTSNVLIYQDTTAWYDYPTLLLGIPGTTGLQNSATAAAVFLGLGKTPLITDIVYYYSIEEIPGINTILITENGQIMIQE